VAGSFSVQFAARAKCDAIAPIARPTSIPRGLDSFDVDLGAAACAADAAVEQAAERQQGRCLPLW